MTAQISLVSVNFRYVDRTSEITLMIFPTVNSQLYANSATFFSGRSSFADLVAEKKDWGYWNGIFTGQGGS